MSEPVANTTPAAPAAAASPNATPAPTQGVTNEPKTVPFDEYERVKGAAFKANRLYEELAQKVDKIQAGPAAAPEVKKPAGVEEQLAALQKRLDESEANAARDRLTTTLTKAAQEHGVAADRMDFLDFRLQKEHGKNLTDKGVPDPTAPGSFITITTLVAGLLAKPEGAVFRSAPSAAALPNGGSNAHGGASGKPRFTREQLETGKVPLEIRKTGNYEIIED
jgi:hypothetical protein